MLNNIVKNKNKLINEIKNGLDVNLRDRKGETLLHYAVMFQQQESIKILLIAGADLTIKNALGFTAPCLSRLLYKKSCFSLFNFKENTFGFDGKLFSFQYVDHLIFKSRYFLYQVAKRIQKYDSAHEIAMHRRWLGAFYRPFIENIQHAEVSIKFIDSNIGFGLFANSSIAKGGYIGEYVGEVRRFLFLTSRSNRYLGEYALGGVDPVRYVIDASHFGNFTRFINHSSHPNASAITVIIDNLLHVIFLAEESISKGAQITFDYGPFYWKKRTPKLLI